jgi:hypothetical protein
MDVLRRRFGSALLLLALVAVATSAVADDKPTIDARQFPGAPVTVTSFTSYMESAAALKVQHVVCVSFHVVGARALSAVKFAVASRDAQGKEYQRLTIDRDGAFAPNASVEGHPQTGRANCREMNIMRADAPFVTVRLVAATYADGGTWAAPETDLPARATPAPATPSPLTSAPPPWSASAHAHYLAVAYGRDSSHVAIFAPGQTVPSTVLEFTTCCAAALAFDSSGTLYVATTRNGIAVFAPGATSPSRRLPSGGTALALDAAGDVAAGGADRDRTVHVYRGAAEANAYAIPARVSAGGLAFAPNGELAVADGSATVAVYAPGATEPARTVPVMPQTNIVRFDAAGHFVAASTVTMGIMLLAPTANIRSIEVKGMRAESLAFDAEGRLLVGIPSGIQPMSPDGKPARRLLGPAADVLAADAGGAFAGGDTARGVVLIYTGDTRTVLGGLDGVRGLAFSP